MLVIRRYRCTSWENLLQRPENTAIVHNAACMQPVIRLVCMHPVCTTRRSYSALCKVTQTREGYDNEIRAMIVTNDGPCIEMKIIRDDALDKGWRFGLYTLEGHTVLVIRSPRAAISPLSRF